MLFLKEVKIGIISLSCQSTLWKVLRVIVAISLEQTKLRITFEPMITSLTYSTKKQKTKLEAGAFYASKRKVGYKSNKLNKCLMHLDILIWVILQSVCSQTILRMCSLKVAKDNIRRQNGFYAVIYARTIFEWLSGTSVIYCNAHCNKYCLSSPSHSHANWYMSV